jgi:hypothetical protein
MQISFLFAIILPLFFAPLWNHGLYRTAYLREKTQIALDNAGILLGRSARVALNALRKAEGVISKLELAHHPAHACARSPLSNAACRATDISLEAIIATTHLAADQLSKSQWVKGEAEARYELRRLGTSLKEWHRATSLPAEKVICPVCALPVRWIVFPDAKKFALRSDGKDDLVLSGIVEKGGDNLAGSWNYKLFSRKVP